MKLNILRLAAAALFCVSTLIVIANVRAQKPLPQPSRELAVSLSSLGIAVPAQTPAAAAAPQEKTVDQTRKNIQVLLSDQSISSLYRVHEQAVATGVPDLAEQHDHYLYGKPKSNG